MNNTAAKKKARETETEDSQATYNLFDPFGLSQAMVDLTQSWTGTPEQLLQDQLNSMDSCLSLWQDSMSRFMGKAGAEEGNNKPTDRRFKHEAWELNPFFDFIKQSYLMGADAILKTVSNIEGLDEKAAHKLEFYTRQFVDAMSPSNFALTNPEVLEHALQTQGQNLVKGFQNFCKDFDPRTGQLQISMADKEAFKLGVNIATTPGQVIYQNDLMQLIQYTPSTETVYKTPLLIVPPWINKYYVLDLQPKNSMIKWLVAQGYTVFVISWINPDENHSEIDFEDYIFDGLITAMDVIETSTGEHEVNAVGYCIGGTLLAAALSYLKAKQDERIKSATFFVTMIDFADPGDLGVYIDEQQVKALENKMNEQGYHDGKDMAMSFNMLRSNDLIWSFYVNNYLLGKEPLPFDLLYWNSDSTRMPAKMHSTYLRKMYLENSFKDKGGISIGDVPIDVSSIDTPAYFISTEDDHIAPWISTYAGAQLFSGPVRFVLGKSGHIAGIVNHPDSGKYGYYTGGDVDVSPEQWYENVESVEGSWWPDWHKWLKATSGKKVPARQPGGDKLEPIEEAPGSYVKMKL